MRPPRIRCWSRDSTTGLKNKSVVKICLTALHPEIERPYPRRFTISLIRSWEKSLATLLNGLMRDASDIVGITTRKGVETGRRGNPTWKECRNYKHELFNPQEHVPYHITSMAAVRSCMARKESCYGSADQICR